MPKETKITQQAMPKEIKEKIENWEKEFNEYNFSNGVPLSYRIKGEEMENLKSFIRQLLAKREKEILEKKNEEIKYLKNELEIADNRWKLYEPYYKQAIEREAEEELYRDKKLT